MPILSRRVILCFSLLLPLGALASVWACSVPVFRYALERWSPDTYRLIVFHRGPFSSQEQAALKGLQDLEELGIEQAPLATQLIDVAQAIPEEMAPLWKAHQSQPLPHAVLLYPLMVGVDTPVWSGAFTSHTKALLTRSPARRELARRLVQGETAVWILVTGGDAAKDEKARKTLKIELAKLEKSLKLPHELAEEDAEYDMPMAEDIDLKIKFSVLEVSRQDKGEALLLAMLLNLDPKLKSTRDPVAFPVYGQGRALTALLGEGISSESLGEIGYFLVGPCSCQVKAQNPGADILIPIDWESLVTGMIGMDEALPPLTVPGARALAGTHEGQPEASAFGLQHNLAILAVVGLAVVVVGSYVLRRRAR